VMFIVVACISLWWASALLPSNPFESCY
jgi:hypothetical protein